MIQLQLRSIPPAPLELDALHPDRLRSASLAELEMLPVACGRDCLPLAEFFQVRGVWQATATAGAAEEPELHLEGDLRRLHRLGERWNQGRLVLHGDVGWHLGAYQSGGEIVVHGSAGPWAGAEKSGGDLQIHGDAGSQLGAAYRGSRLGMTGGRILVFGSAGDEVGVLLRRGVILVGGAVGDFAGTMMIAGTIAAARAGLALGAGMKRGTIWLAQPPQQVSPGHQPIGCHRFAYHGFWQKSLTDLPAGPWPSGWFYPGAWEGYRGDWLQGGRGELWWPETTPA